jgi:hypothetical protein
MSIATLRLIVGVFFLLASVFLALRYWIVPEWASRYDPLRMNLGAAFALVFGLLNLTRWYLSWSQRQRMALPVRYPLQPDPSLVRPEVRPELDFLTQHAVSPSSAATESPKPDET